MTDQIFIDGALRTLDATTGPELERRLGLAGRVETLLVRKGRARDIAAHLDRLVHAVRLAQGLCAAKFCCAKRRIILGNFVVGFCRQLIAF